jgi:methylated-DNA-[protein]-cysteine S-methyltransferase
MKSFYSRINTPIGDLYAIATETALTHLLFASDWQDYRKNHPELMNQTTPLIKNVKIQLAEYFIKKRTHFDIPLRLEGTAFQIQAWRELIKIPFGQTITYSEQAKNIKNPQAIRAVGTANSKNPICIIIPCHRVIAKGGKLGGFSGGINNKKKLLLLEGLSFSEL